MPTETKQVLAIRVTPTELAAWKNRAEELGVDVSKWVRHVCNTELNGDRIGALKEKIQGQLAEFNDHGDDQNLRRDGDLPVAPGRVTAVEGLSTAPNTVSGYEDQPTVEAEVTSAPAPKKKQTTATLFPNPTALQEEVARRTGHQVGCECFHCLQTMRFLAPPPPKKSRKEQKEEDKKKRGRKR